MDSLKGPDNKHFLRTLQQAKEEGWERGTFATSAFWKDAGYYVKKHNLRCWNEVNNPMLHEQADCGAPTGAQAVLVEGTTLLLRFAVANIAHFFSDQYYSFYALASRPDIFNLPGIDNICIVANRGRMHEYLALNLLPPHIKKKVRLLKKDTLYVFDEAIIGTEDRVFHYRENNQTLIREMRENFYKNTNLDLDLRPQGKALIHQNRQGSSSYGRQILNLEELCKGLEDEGIEPFVLYSDTYWMSAEPDLLLLPFIESNIFIGVWGAWLNNLLIAKPESSIFCLRHPRFRAHWYTECPGYRHSAFDYHNRELGTYFYEVPCAHEPPDYPPRQVFKPPWNSEENIACCFADIPFILQSL